MLPWETLLPLLLILSLGIFVQASAGFAAGLVSVPLLLWGGYQLPEAQTALLVATLPQNLAGVWSFRSYVTVREIRFPALLRVATLPLGAWLLVALDNLPREQISQFVGGVVLLVTLTIIVARPKPRESLPIAWSWLAFTSSGFLQGLVGMGGPMMVLWVQAHDWGTRRTRAFLFSMYLVSIVPALFVLWLLFGSRIVETAMATLIFIPWLLVVTWGGLRVGTWLGRARLRIVTFGLLLVIGLLSLAKPWLPF
ncbi:Sulfite exporter TauE/SafE [Roseimaritima multifibrata]|uniref:Probable membrane transporter protein n=1 Tax=Roseimaritima multifibrata TaxID=1930274 RepID=A0A517MB84_9BACT|nr:sulfite exporter TauE/SafE family protein [Roseimaritima multifibrata]QDS92136.1 Sulfite exporter TauE/SafE [Roseimaritima multifibrata]